jgi:hypothetical protein
MPNTDDIRWFKKQFHRQINAAVAGTPFSLDMLTALACQESGEVWPILRNQNLDLNRLLELCVGDTLDADKGRRAFPKNRAALEARPNGQQMFAIARQALVDMAVYIDSYQGAAAKPNKFCRGFGIFQYDLQFFLEDPHYFLEKRYADFDTCLAKCIGELRQAMQRMHWEDKTALTDYEMACVGIAYNTGSFNPELGLKQGHKSGGKYYGENLFDFLRLSKTVEVPGQGPPGLSAPRPGHAAISPPSPVAATGPFYEVDVRATPLNLRREPTIDPDAPSANVIARLPDGQLVRAVTDKKVNDFLEVETSLWGAHLRGFAAAAYLQPAPGVDALPMVTPAATPPSRGIVAVYMPSQPDLVTRRTERPDAHSLNEPNQPRRQGTTADALRAELAAIVAWLAVDNPAHLRYQREPNKTYCNIYAHDFCHLAGVYLPRVWWLQGAIARLAQGEEVKPHYGKTIDEQRANDLFRWLRDFGEQFGWRQTGTPSKLQLEVNQGAVGLIVARRNEDGRPGHIVAVVPETDKHRARRNAAGDVIIPLQSQAGSTNFPYGTGKLEWWRGDQFAESAFWLHA